MDFDAYRSIDALNWSSLKNMATSALLYRWRVDHPRPDTDALVLGRAIHMAVLEPDLFEHQYTIRPRDIDLRTKIGKAWKANLDPSLTIVSADHGQVIKNVKRSLASHRDVTRLLYDAHRREETITWTTDGISSKARLDAVGEEILIDLKTTRDLVWFERDAARLRYHGQMAWYRDGAEESRILSRDAASYIIAVETSEPYDVAVYRLSQSYLEAGRRLYNRLLGYWRECERADIWPGLCPSICDLDLPDWAIISEDGGI